MDSIIRDFKGQTGIKIVLFTFDSLMTTKDSVSAVTQIIGTKHQINTTVGISLLFKGMYIWNDSLTNNTVLYQFETKDIIDKNFIPFFKKEEYFNGTFEGIKAIMHKINNNRRAKNHLKNGG